MNDARLAELEFAANPSETAVVVRNRADAVQSLAKKHSRSDVATRFGALAIDGQEQIERFDHPAV